MRNLAEQIVEVFWQIILGAYAAPLFLITPLATWSVDHPFVGIAVIVVLSCLVSVLLLG